MQEKRTRTQQDRTQATLAALKGAARQLFVQRGYAATSTPDIVHAAAVTRGALYHHFADKAALFFAVAQQMAQEVSDAIAAGSAHSGSPMQALLDGSHAYFQAMAEGGRAQLLLLDAPSVLNAQQMQWLSDMAGAQALRDGLSALLSNSTTHTRIRRAELDALTQLLSAAFDRTALALARQQDITAHKAALRKLLQGIGQAYRK